jgi:hypothetical protein
VVQQGLDAFYRDAGRREFSLYGEVCRSVSLPLVLSDRTAASPTCRAARTMAIVCEVSLQTAFR